MAAQHARERRGVKLQELDIQYPFWVFDVDQPAWPRKLATIPPHSRPAQVVGWYAWPWEYGTALQCITDPLPSNVVVSSDTARGKSRDPKALQRLLDRLQYDEDIPLPAFDVVYENHAGTGNSDDSKAFLTRNLRDWVFDPSAENCVAPQRVHRIERRWDRVPFWTREDPAANLFSSNSEQVENSGKVAYGVATLVHDDAGLMAASGAEEKNDGEKVRKIGIEILDDSGRVVELVEGVVLPRKDREPTFHGLVVSRGPEYAGNKEILRDTALEKAAWAEVEEYVYSRRKGPLW